MKIKMITVSKIGAVILSLIALEEIWALCVDGYADFTTRLFLSLFILTNIGIVALFYGIPLFVLYYYGFKDNKQNLIYPAVIVLAYLVFLAVF